MSSMQHRAAILALARLLLLQAHLRLATRNQRKISHTQYDSCLGYKASCPSPTSLGAVLAFLVDAPQEVKSFTISVCRWKAAWPSALVYHFKAGVQHLCQALPRKKSHPGTGHS